MDEAQKTCTKCHTPKSLEQFAVQRRGKFGRKAQCRDCDKIWLKAWKAIARKRQVQSPPDKLCARCGEQKPFSAFRARLESSDGLSPWCKVCQTESTAERRREFKRYVNSIKESKPCADCGQRHPFWVMQFDHLPGFKKVCMISTGCSVGVGGKQAVLSEIDKCELVCANCHATRTHIRSGRA